MPAKAKRSEKPKRKRDSKEEAEELEEWKKSRQLLKPKDQVELSDADLKEIIANVLVTNNPQIPTDIVEFSYAQGIFIPVPSPGSMVVAYEYQGTTIPKDSEEAFLQLVEQGIDAQDIISEESAEEEEEESKEKLDEVKQESVKGEPETDEGEKEEGDKEEGAEDEEAKADEEKQDGEEEGEESESVKPKKQEPKTGGKTRKLTNQFNFCERAALTYNNPTRSQETQTIPPPMVTFSGNVLQWIIYDAYIQDFEAQELEKRLEMEKKELGKAPVGKQVVKKAKGKKEFGEEVEKRILECWKVLERMVNQNTYRDIAQDYRYWDDPSDEYREEEGTLLPLWKFTYDKTKKNTVTDIMWNQYYYDLFVACFGYLDFMKPISGGALCVFTLKNPSYPDYIMMTDSAVMCVDIHRKYPYMIAVGLHSGTVLVYNIQATCQKPAYKSNNVLNKHRGIVWEVKWLPDLPDGELNFFSASTDGKIKNWVLMQTDLVATTVITLYMDMPPVQGPDGTQIKLKGSASCIKVSPKDPLIYMVGTEEGKIYKCSVAYNSMFLLEIDAHEMPVIRINFNKFNPDIFISCSSDWRIKIWEDNRLAPLFVFDIGDRIGDVKWAPYSSTVFAAAASGGSVYVFDLNVNKYKPIAVQAIVSKRRNRLYKLSFNPKLPIILVGDDKGCITSLKLSPNLRIPCKAPKKQQHLDQFTLQVMKLESLLALVREPTTLSLPEDTAGTEDD